MLMTLGLVDNMPRSIQIDVLYKNLPQASSFPWGKYKQHQNNNP